jgi:SAM-dependent methyltransferase
VLDIGCGTGRVMEHLAPWCREVHGIDISERMVAGGRERLAHLSNVQFHHGNGYDLAGFEDGSFDVVYSIVALQHMPRTVAYNYLLESNRVLTEDGVLWCYVPNLLRDDAFAAFHHLSQPWFVSHPYPMNFYTPQEIARVVVAAGFWLAALNDEMRVEASKTAGAGVSEQAQALVGLDDTKMQRLAERNAELERTLAEIRSQPLVRLAASVRRRLRPTPS